MVNLPQIREPDLPDIEAPELPTIRGPDLPRVESAAPKVAKGAAKAPQTVATFLKSRGLADDPKMRQAATEIASMVREAGGDEAAVSQTLIEWWGGGDLVAALAALPSRPGNLTAEERAVLEEELVDLIRSPMLNTRKEQRRADRRRDLTRILGVGDED